MEMMLCHLYMKVGGDWLSWWVVAAAAVSQIGQFEAEMSSDSFQLLGMAERGFLPAALAKRSKHDTPTIGIILSSLGILTLVTFNFTQASKSLFCPLDKGWTCSDHGRLFLIESKCRL